MPCITRLLRAAVVACITVMPAAAAPARDLAGFSVMLQFGPSTAPWAIAISPDRKWFLTASQFQLYLWDLKTGAVLRRLDLGVLKGDRLVRVAISDDGDAIFARSAGRDSGEKILGWASATGTPMTHADAVAPPQVSSNWSWIEHVWPESAAAPYDAQAPKKYLIDNKIDRLVELNAVNWVEATNDQNIVEVSVGGKDTQSDAFEFSLVDYYFIDVAHKKIVVKVSGKTIPQSCGEPRGAFAFDGQNLVLAPTELDASSAFISALVVDVRANRSSVKWSHFCQDFQVSSIEVKNGLIVDRDAPDVATIWDPASGRKLALLEDICDSDVLEWSEDLTTFATGYHESRSVSEKDIYGIALLRSGKKSFIPTGQEVVEIRFSPDGTTLFARTKALWTMWDASTGKKFGPAGGQIEVPPEGTLDAREVTRLDDVHDNRAYAWSREPPPVVSQRPEGSPLGNKALGVWIMRAGEKRFLQTDQEVAELRFNSGANLAFTRTETDAGWGAWDTSTGTKLAAVVDLPLEIPKAKSAVTREDHTTSPAGIKSVVMRDAATGQWLWTATANNPTGSTAKDDLLIMEFPDGRVRLSEGAESLIRLVSGFEVRPFDAAAKSRFLHP